MFLLKLLMYVCEKKQPKITASINAWGYVNENLISVLNYKQAHAYTQLHMGMCRHEIKPVKVNV